MSLDRKVSSGLVFVLLTILVKISAESFTHTNKSIVDEAFE